MSQLVADGRTRVIEGLFHRYPDTPREVIVKQDLLGLGQNFSDSALEAAAGCLVKSYRLFSYDLVPMSNMQRREHQKVPEWFVIKGGPYGLRPVTVQTTLATDSPYLIDVIDGRLKLCLDGVAVADVGYPRPLKYYSKFFPDGTAYRDVIAFGHFITIFRFCQFWGAQEECKFCDINENARQMRKSKAYTLTAPMKTVEQVAEVANAIGREVMETEGYPRPISFILTGGTITSELHGLKEEDFYLRYVEAVKWGGPRRYITLQTNAADKETLRRYRHTGVDSHNPNMEVWDKRLFEWICPGKSKRVGWEEWVRRTVESVDIFGEANVRPNFVCGVEMAQPYGFKSVEEAVKSTTEGMRFLMSRGVLPRFNQWRREPSAYLQKNYSQPPVPPEFYIQLMGNYYDIWKRYDLPLAHWVSDGSPSRMAAHPESRAMGPAHGVYDDYPLLMEDKDYENRVLQALEKAGTVWSYILE